MKKIRLVFKISLIACLVPIIISIPPGIIAAIAGCTITSGPAEPCLIAGVDWYGPLHNLTMLGVLGMVTIPLFIVILMIWGVTEVIYKYKIA